LADSVIFLSNAGLSQCFAISPLNGIICFFCF
jgi:hypothetical protein